MLVNIEVTQEDIDTGRPRLPSSCAVALAVRRVIANRATVGPYRILVYSEGNEPVHDIKLPEFVPVQVGRFDTGEQIEPFTFPLDIPSKYLKAPG